MLMPTIYPSNSTLIRINIQRMLMVMLICRMQLSPPAHAVLRPACVAGINGHSTNLALRLLWVTRY